MVARRVVVVAIAALAIAACSKKADDQAKKPMTQAHRDSAIAASKLPGAGVVKKAIEVSDSAKARAESNNPE